MTHFLIPVLVEQPKAFAKCEAALTRKTVHSEQGLECTGMTMGGIDVFNSSMWGIFACATFTNSLARGIMDNSASRCI